MGIRVIAVYSEADADLPYVAEADEAVLIGPAQARLSYLNAEAILAAAARTGAQAIHPGYGFLAENAEFAQRVIDAGLTWIGPSPYAIEQMGDKIRARNLMADVGHPGRPRQLGAGRGRGRCRRARQADRLPGHDQGGCGRRRHRDDHRGRRRAAAGGFETARSRAERFFGDPSILIERYITSARHVEVQILGLADGQVIALGERDCSAQRRHQKLAEETPSPASAPICASGCSPRPSGRGRRSATAARARSSAWWTAETGEFVFLEMNTRLQVEHPVTEMVTGIDLVEQQLLIADGAEVSFDPASVQPSGHALELRVYAEDPVRFLPSPGTITEWNEQAATGCGWTRVMPPGTSSRRTTTRCWPSWSCTARTASRRWNARGRRSRSSW